MFLKKLEMAQNSQINRFTRIKTKQLADLWLIHWVKPTIFINELFYKRIPNTLFFTIDNWSILWMKIMTRWHFWDWWSCCVILFSNEVILRARCALFVDLVLVELVVDPSGTGWWQELCSRILAHFKTVQIKFQL